MSIKVNPSFIKDVKKFGAFDISACFNCGNCTAVCPLSKGTDNFPRRLIRNTQIGNKEAILNSRNLWMCYYCGECSDTCPREAEPGEFMASARRMAISEYDITGISKRLYTSNIFNIVFLIIVGLVFSVLFVYKHGNIDLNQLSFFEYISYELIHITGVAIMILVSIAAGVGLLKMLMRFYSEYKDTIKDKLSIKNIVMACIYSAKESIFQKRYRDCDETDKPIYLKRWFIHITILWGFIGLLCATTLNYLFKPASPIVLDIANKILPSNIVNYLFVHPVGGYVSIFYPIRLLGTLSGILFIYGTLVTLIFRLKKTDKYHSHSNLSDWYFILIMFLVGVTGFILEIGIYLPNVHSLLYAIFVIHIVLSMEMLILFSLTKFAHAVYRPMGLLFEYFANEIYVN